jgi:PAS domain S-box-containing protein
LIELSPQPMLAHSGGAFLYMNAAGFRLLGADAGAGLAVQTIYDIVHPEDRKAVIRRAKQTAGSKYAGVMEYRIIRQDSQSVEVEATEIYDDFTKTTLTLFTDITERGALPEACRDVSRRYRRLQGRGDYLFKSGRLPDAGSGRRV